MSDPDCFCPDILSGDCLKIILSLAFLLEIIFIYTFTELHIISICTFIKIGSFDCPGWKGKGSKH